MLKKHMTSTAVAALVQVPVATYVKSSPNVWKFTCIKWAKEKCGTFYCPHLRQMIQFSGQLAIRWLSNIPPHLNCVATLPCEI